MCENNQSIITYWQIYLDGYLCGTIQYVQGTNPYRIECGTVLARNVTLVKEFTDRLNGLVLCEVEVLSRKPPGTPYWHDLQSNLLDIFMRDKIPGIEFSGGFSKNSQILCRKLNF